MWCIRTGATRAANKAVPFGAAAGWVRSGPFFWGGRCWKQFPICKNECVFRVDSCVPWIEKDFNFDASLLKPGANTIVLTVPAGGVANGICYDVVRLEVAPPAP